MALCCSLSIRTYLWLCFSVSIDNLPPTAIVLQTSTYIPPSGMADTVVTTLSAVDANSAESFSFSVLPGYDGSLFNVAGNSLRFSNANQRGSGLKVSLQVEDSKGLLYSELFTIDEGMKMHLTLFVSLFFSLIVCVFQ